MLKRKIPLAILGLGASSLSWSPALAGVALPPRADMRIVVISDINSEYGSTSYDSEVSTAVSWILNWKPDLVLATGDLVAGQSSSLSDEQVRAMWAAFDRVVFNPIRAAGIPFALTLGNHDASLRADRTRASQFWQSRRAGLGVEILDGEAFPHRYTFAHKGVFFSSMDAPAGTISSEQLTWLRGQLAGARATQAPMRIALGHLPLFAVAQGRNAAGEVIGNPQPVKDVLRAGRVWGYLSGHHHAFFPGQEGVLKFIHNGALGGGPRKLLGSNAAPRKTLTVLDVMPAQGWVGYTAIDMGRQQVLDSGSLPAQVEGINGALARWDSPARPAAPVMTNQRALSCPGGFLPTPVNSAGGVLCTQGDVAMGPFSGPMKQACFQQWGGNEGCWTDAAWSLQIASATYGAGLCPAGAIDVGQGRCRENGDLPVVVEQTTYLKRRPEQAAALPDAEKCQLPVGAKLWINAWEDAPLAHVRVSIVQAPPPCDGFVGDAYVYWPHLALARSF